MDTCFCDTFKLVSEIFIREKSIVRIILVPDEERDVNHELDELTATVRRAQYDLRKILSSKSNTELIEVQNTLQNANSKFKKYHIQLPNNKTIIIHSPFTYIHT